MPADLPKISDLPALVADLAARVADLEAQAGVNRAEIARLRERADRAARQLRTGRAP